MKYVSMMVVTLIIACSQPFKERTSPEFETAMQGLFPDDVVSRMYASADVVIEGTILDINCIQDETGVLSCRYGMKIDSVFKGIPITTSRPIIPSRSIGFPNSQYLAPRTETHGELLEFTRHCAYWLQDLGRSDVPDNCPTLDQQLVLFLSTKNVQDREYYKLLNHYFGAIQSNLYLALKLRSCERLLTNNR